MFLRGQPELRRLLLFKKLTILLINSVQIFHFVQDSGKNYNKEEYRYVTG